MADPYAGRRYSDRTGKGLYEDQVEGLSSGLRQLFGGGVSPRKSEGAVTPMAAATLTPSAPKPPASSQPSASQGDLRRFDTGGDAQRPGLAAGYSASQTRTPSVMRVDGGRSPLFTNIEPAEAVEGLRGGTVSNIGDANEGFARMARANAIRQGQLDAAGGPKVAMIGNSDRAQWERNIDKFSMVGKSGGRAGRAQQAIDLQEDGLRQRAEEAAMKNSAEMQKLAQLDEMGRRRDALDREKFEFDKEDAASVRSLRDAQAEYYRTGGSGSDKAPAGLKGPKEVASAAEALYGPERASVVANDVEARRRDGIRRANEAGDSALAQALATGDVPEAAVKIDGDLGIVRDVAASENMFGRGASTAGQGAGLGAAIGGLASLVATRGKTGWKPLLAWLGAGGATGLMGGGTYGVTTAAKGVTSNTPAYQLEGWTRGEDGTWVSPDGKASIPEAALRNPGLWSAITGLGGRDITPYLEALGYKP